MIFVTLGNARQSFARSLNAVAALSAAGVFSDEEIVVQHGHTPMPAGSAAVALPFMAHADFEDHVRRASVIVCHGGCGTVLSCLRASKVPVIIPRRKRYGEHINDHQLQLAGELARQGRAIMCDDVERLGAAIEAARTARPPVSTGEPVLPALVRSAIRDLIDRRRH